MIGTFIDVILPVFLIIAAGYVCVKTKFLTQPSVENVMLFAQKVALPCLLFQSISKINLSHAYDLGMIFSYYGGALSCFMLGYLGARFIFKRSASESVVIGFAATFSNSVLLGLPVMERAYGKDSLAGNYAIISLHTPILYSFGITFMELVRSGHRNISSFQLAQKVIKSIFSQSLMIGIILGFAVNFLDFLPPLSLNASITLLAQSAIPVALFSLGGTLSCYSFEGERGVILMVSFLSLLCHPLITWLLGVYVFHLSAPALRSAVVIAAMAPGISAYIFANLYGVSRRVNAASILVATAGSIMTISLWLYILP